MELSATERTAVLASLVRMGLIGEGESPVLTPLAGGVSSLIVRAEVARGTVCVKAALPTLRTAAEWHAPIERNAAEVAWMELALPVVPGRVAEIVAKDPAGSAFAMTYFEPSAFPVWKAQLRDGVAVPATASAVATTLVTIHAATANDEARAREFSNDASFYALRVEPYFAEAARRRPACADALSRVQHLLMTTKRAVVHGDASPKNVLVGEQGPVLLDAECACYGDPAFDLAFVLHHLLLKRIWRPYFQTLYLTSSHQFTTTYLERVTWEPVADLEARAATYLPALLLARVDGKSPVEYIQDDTVRDEVRRFAQRYLLEPTPTLASIVDAWNGSRPI